MQEGFSVSDLISGDQDKLRLWEVVLGVSVSFFSPSADSGSQGKRAPAPAVIFFFLGQQQGG